MSERRLPMHLRMTDEERIESDLREAHSVLLGVLDDVPDLPDVVREAIAECDRLWDEYTGG